MIALAGLIVYSGIIGSMNCWLLLLLFTVTGVIMAVNVLADRRTIKYDEEYVKVSRSYEYLKREVLVPANGKDMRLYRMWDWFRKEFKQMTEALAYWSGRERKCSINASIFGAFLTGARDLLVYGYLIHQMVQGRIDMAAFLLYVGIVASFGSWMNSLTQALTGVVHNNRYMDRYRDFLEFAEKRFGGSQAVTNPGKPHEIRLEHVSFRYEGCLVVAAGLLFGVAGQLVEKAYARSSQRCALAFAVMMREKAASLDYETMEQPQVTDKIFLSERTAGMYGGLGAVVNSYQGMLTGLLEIVTAIGMIGVLCFSRPAAGGSLLALAAQPAVSVFLLLLALGLTIAARIRAGNGMVRNTKKYLQDHAGMEMKLSYLLSQVMMNLQAAKVIRIYDMKKMLMDNIRKCDEASNEFYGEMCNEEIRGRLRGDLNSGFFTVFSYLFVAVKVLAGTITIGAFTQYTGAMAKLSGGFQGVIWHNTQIRRTNTYMADFLELMNMKNNHATGTIPVEKRLDGEYEIEFRDVSFRYPGSEETILKHVNCKLTMKNKLALVGKNGAGKTTFIKLLCRLYEPTEGVITLNGIDIRKYREEEYRELFGVVFQDFKLFAFPLWQNLTAGYERDDDRISDCLKRAGAEEFVRGLPQGTDTLLFKDREGGVDISGGEAQKLALARALYKDAPFVILDEPTAALDPVSEAQVYAGFHEMVKDKTSIYISHRMSSCRFCDDIVVFEDGRIVERGNHEELLERQGQYAEMWHAQAKYYVTEAAQ